MCADACVIFRLVSATIVGPHKPNSYKNCVMGDSPSSHKNGRFAGYPPPQLPLDGIQGNSDFRKIVLKGLIGLIIAKPTIATV